MNGYLLLNKPTGMSSFYALRQIRKKLGIKRIGHCGTLDPLATGMLPVMVGEGTKYASMLNSQDKSYTVTAMFGAVSNTFDADGEISPNPSFKGINLDEVKHQLAQFIGPIEQKPPSFSAIRIDGKRAYELARKGQVVDLAKRPVTVHAFSIIETPEPNANQFRVVCSKGTYIRSLIHDLGQVLGTGALVTQLHREWVAPFDHGNMTELDSLSHEDLLPLASLFEQSTLLNPIELNAIHHGQSINCNETFTAAPIALVDENGKFHGAGIMRDNRIHPKKLISQSVHQD